MSRYFGRGFNVIEPPIVYEPPPVERRLVRYPRVVPEYPRVVPEYPRVVPEYPPYYPEVKRRIRYVAPAHRARPLIVRKPVEIQERDIWYPSRPIETAPSYVNYKIKPALPPIRENYYYDDWYERDIVRDNSQTYKTEDDFYSAPIIRRKTVALAPQAYSLPVPPKFYYHKSPPAVVPYRRYIDDVDPRYIKAYRHADDYRYYNRHEDFNKKKLRYLMQQRRQQGFI